MPEFKVGDRAKALDRPGWPGGYKIANWEEPQICGEHKMKSREEYLKIPLKERFIKLDKTEEVLTLNPETAKLLLLLRR